MKKQNSSRNRRSNSSSYSSKSRSGFSSTPRSGKRYRSKGFSSRNNRYKKTQMAHSMYISKAEDIQTLAYESQRTFNDFSLNPTLKQNIFDVNYKKPTKIQDSAIEHIINGKDVLAIASTGSGKTGAFLIPMVNKAIQQPNCKVFIITPTRELAKQIQTEFRKFAKNTRVTSVLIIGGESIGKQIRVLKRQPQFVIATPGRLMDVEERNCINLKLFNNVILDEVDQMLDMGFITDIKKIINLLGEDKQSLFFSATLKAKEEALANALLQNPVKIETHKQSPLKSIEQDIVKIHNVNQKAEVLANLLLKDDFKKVLVFSRTKRGADKISKNLRELGIRVSALHGGKTQNKRSKVLETFRRNEIDVLVATDVAARGIDVPNITHVINYDEPQTYNDYIHRIGRTGRSGKKGNALTFVEIKY